MALRRALHPLLVGSQRGRPRRFYVLLLYPLTGLLLGLGLTQPAFSLGSWLAVVCLSAALTWTESRMVALVGATFAHLLARLVGLDWVQAMNDAVFSLTPSQSYVLLVVESLAWALPLGAAIGLGFALLRRRVGVCWWLPIAWGLGETLRFGLFALNIGDWLNTQWMVTPVLRMLGLLGWWPTLFVCLFAAACLGQAVAVRQRWLALLPLVVMTGMLLLPALPSTGEEMLRGVAVVHTNSMVALPDRVPPADGADDRLELVVWPETAFHIRPIMGEGEGNGTRLPALIHGVEVEQVIGVETRRPRGGVQNQVMVVGGDGRVRASRAKRLLLPGAERRMFGFGRDSHRPGERLVRLDAGQRSMIPLICGELLSRALVAEGRRAGGELMVVVAGDFAFGNARAKRQLLAVQVMRSVEFGVPSVRASYGGWANFIASDGRVLALSGDSRNGLLRWDRDRGARDTDFRGEPITDEPASQTPPAEIIVLYSRDAPQFRTRCPEGRCRYVELEDFHCLEEPVATVVVAGHGAPPSYLSHTPAQVAAAIRCFSPELIVIDTCFGASGDLLNELAPLAAEVVAAPFMLPTKGLLYLPEFFSSAQPHRRALAVKSSQGGELLRWRIDADELASAYARAAAMDGSSLRRNLVRRRPAQVGVALGTGRVLVPFDWRRMQGARGAGGVGNPRRSYGDKPRIGGR